MALFVLGDTHLSLGASKPMDIFPGWDGYLERLERNWRRLIGPQDTVVLAGDISWAMRLSDTRKDFAFLQGLPGRKLIMKGNHDYWWSTANKMNAYFKAEGFDTLHLLHNNSHSVDGNTRYGFIHAFTERFCVCAQSMNTASGSYSTARPCVPVRYALQGKCLDG